MKLEENDKYSIEWGADCRSLARARLEWRGRWAYILLDRSSFVDIGAEPDAIPNGGHIQ
jgi:hypothetical protein